MGELRYIYAGDKVAAQSYIGEANKQHLKLREYMGFRDLKIGQRSLPFDNGVIITNTIVRGIETATIYVPEVGGGGEQQEKKCFCSKCFCSCDLSVGTVLDVIEHTDGYTYIHVKCCFNGKRYKRYYWLRASDYTPWETGMGIVLLYYYTRTSYDCSESSSQDYTGCLPSDNEDIEPEEDDFTPETFIILPMCANSLNKWIN